MKEFILAVFFLLAQSAHSDEKPSWYAKDAKTDSGWDFFCTGTAEDEDKSLAIGQSQCSQKICMLFGVEVTAEVKSEETLNAASVKNTVIEKCPNVRVTGRVEKKKLVDCGEKECISFVHHFYPKAEYEKEYERLNRPAMVKEFEKTIIIREGNKTFKDPKVCQEKLKEYLDVRGENEKSYFFRKASLVIAAKECEALDDRNVSLQSELRGYLSKSLIHRPHGFAFRLSSHVLGGGELTVIIKNFLQLETDFFEGSKYEDSARKIVLHHFDWLYRRNSYIGKVGWVLLNGKVVNEDPIETELKTCEKHSLVLSKWPDKFFGEIQVCAPNTTGGEICMPVSELLLRFKYLNCLCTKETKRTNECVTNLNQFVTDNCHDRLNAGCMKQLKKHASDSLYLSNIKPKK